ncbi:MAG: YfiR family protein [Chitinophagaceae bacterium]
MTIRSIFESFNRTLTCLTGFLLLSAANLAAQQGNNDAVNANIIYHFTKYINWPPEKKSKNFVIGIVGETGLYDELKNTTAGKMAGNQNIVIRRYKASAKIFDCQILFITDEEGGDLKKLVVATTGNPILIVTESEGLAKQGSCINFVIADDHLKLEINKTNIEKRNLNIASDLLKLGVVVK